MDETFVIFSCAYPVHEIAAIPFSKKTLLLAGAVALTAASACSVEESVGNFESATSFSEVGTAEGIEAVVLFEACGDRALAREVMQTADSNAYIA